MKRIELLKDQVLTQVNVNPKGKILNEKPFVKSPGIEEVVEKLNEVINSVNNLITMYNIKNN